MYFEHTSRYGLYVHGPDDLNTWPECWGANATSPGRLVAEADRLVDLLGAVRRIPHSNWTIYGPDGMTLNRREYYARPSVVKALRRRQREEAKE